MTQPEEAVGGEPIVDSQLTPEDRLNAAFDDPANHQEEEEPVAEEDESPEAAEDEIEVEAEDLPPIEPPVSLSAEDKEAFKAWPRDAQETFSKRVTEIEKGFHAKAQEAAQAKSAARNEALQYAAQIKADTASQLEKYAQQLAVNPPDARLYASDPMAYAQQLEAYQHYTAQSQQAQREAEKVRAEQAQYEAALEQEERTSFVQAIQDEFPDYLDPQRGPEIARNLSAIANELGYPPELIQQARAPDILAMRKAAEWKAKADKFDRAMTKQMERVRAGKGKLPPVSKPGAPSKPGVQAQARYQADREAMKHGDKDAATRVLDSFFQTSK